MTEQTKPLTSIDLDEIDGRAAHLYEYADPTDAAWEILAGDDVPALLREVRQQRDELGAFRALELGDPDGRVSASCGDPEHPTWLRKLDDTRGCPWCENERLHDDLTAERERHKEGLRRADEQVNAMNEELKRYADGTETPVLWSVYNAMHLRAANAETRVAQLEAAPTTVPAAYELATRTHLAAQLGQVINRCAKRALDADMPLRRDLIARGMGLLSALHLLEEGSADNTEQDGEFAGYDPDADPDSGFPNEPIPYKDPTGYTAETLLTRRGIRPAPSEAGASVLAELKQLRAELKKYVGKEPTIADEMAHLNRCIDAVDALQLPETLKVDSISGDYRNGYIHALADMRTALEAPERKTYPPALPWAQLMEDEDLSDFLDELMDATTTPGHSKALAEVEATCARWRVIAEAQHAHNTAPGPDAETGEGQ